MDAYVNPPTALTTRNFTGKSDVKFEGKKNAKSEYIFEVDPDIDWPPEPDLGLKMTTKQWVDQSVRTVGLYYKNKIEKQPDQGK